MILDEYSISILTSSTWRLDISCLYAGAHSWHNPLMPIGLKLQAILCPSPNLLISIQACCLDAFPPRTLDCWPSRMAVATKFCSSPGSTDPEKNSEPSALRAC